MSRSTHIICVIDKSGSMHAVRQQAIDSINAFIAEQQTVNLPASFSLILFDTSVRVHCSHKPLAQVQYLSAQDYVPAGGTALLDAIGSAIARPTEQAADQTLVVIVTDGRENSSVEYSQGAIASAVGALEQSGLWKFQFLGANNSALTQANALGLTTAYTADSGDMQAETMFAIMRAASMNARYFRQTGDTLELTPLLLQELARQHLSTDADGSRIGEPSAGDHHRGARYKSNTAESRMSMLPV